MKRLLLILLLFSCSKKQEDVKPVTVNVIHDQYNLYLQQQITSDQHSINTTIANSSIYYIEDNGKFITNPVAGFNDTIAINSGFGTIQQGSMTYNNYKYKTINIDFYYQGNHYITNYRKQI